MQNPFCQPRMIALCAVVRSKAPLFLKHCPSSPLDWLVTMASCSGSPQGMAAKQNFEISPGDLVISSYLHHLPHPFSELARLWPQPWTWPSFVSIRLEALLRRPVGQDGHRGNKIWLCLTISELSNTVWVILPFQKYGTVTFGGIPHCWINPLMREYQGGLLHALF